MIPYPIHIEQDDTSEYDPFLHHVIRHKLRKKKNRKRLGRLFRKHPKTRMLRSLGIIRGRRRPSTIRRPVRPVRTVSRRYRRPRSRPTRNTLVSKPGMIKKPFKMPPVRFGDPTQRDRELNDKVLKKPYWKGPPIMPGDPSNRTKPQVFVSKPSSRKKPPVSKDIVIPYKRRYRRGKPRTMKTSKKKPRQEIAPLAEETPGVAQELTTTKTQVMERTKENQQPQVTKSKRTTRNIIGVTVLGLVVAGFIMYKMKTKMEANGRTS